MSVGDLLDAVPLWPFLVFGGLSLLGGLVLIATDPHRRR